MSHFPKSYSNSKTIVHQLRSSFLGEEGGYPLNPQNLINLPMSRKASLHLWGLLNLITADKHCQPQPRRPKSTGSCPSCHHSGLLQPSPREQSWATTQLWLGGRDPFAILYWVNDAKPWLKWVESNMYVCVYLETCSWILLHETVCTHSQTGSEKEMGWGLRVILFEVQVWYDHSCRSCQKTPEALYQIS